jgi:hypothetical protein
VTDLRHAGQTISSSVYECCDVYAFALRILRNNATNDPAPLNPLSRIHIDLHKVLFSTGEVPPER